LLVIVSGGSLAGCATVTRGTTEVLAIQSEPEGAVVELSSGQRCTTPCSLELKRKCDYRLYLRREGFRDVEVAVQSRDAGDSDRLCGPADSVAGAVCRDLLRTGATRDEVRQLLGEPQATRADGIEWQYGHDTLVFDEGGRFASTRIVK
jgi:hypothetical protein